MVEVGLLLSGFLGFLFFCGVLVRWNERMFRGKGPPVGAVGWPLIGETIEFLLQGHDFTKIRRLRYGNLFKTHVLGSPLVVSTDADMNKTIFMKEGKGLVMGYPQAMMDLLGKHNLARLNGALHKSVRGVVLSLISPQAIRETLLPQLDSFMQAYLCGLGGQIIDFQEMTKEVALSILLELIVGIKKGEIRDTLIHEFPILTSGFFCLPINLPGLTYNRALKARKKIVSILEDVLRRRRQSSLGESRDMLDLMLHGDEQTIQLTDDQIIDLIVTLVFAGLDTVSTTLMMALIYLHNHPRVLQEIRDEHLEIRKTKSAGEAINWNEYKGMNFTRSVILETMRLASVVPGTFKHASEDVEINGVSIPKGWRIYVCMRENNYDPTHYPEPFEFNPWRWQDKSLETHNRFQIFGGGCRLCPGKEIGILQISMFLHYFLTRYKWEAMGELKINIFPKLEAPKGLPFRIWEV